MEKDLTGWAAWVRRPVFRDTLQWVSLVRVLQNFRLCT